MIRFRITCEKSPGVLTKIVVGMRRSELEILKQHVDDSGENRVLDLDFEAGKEQAAKIYNRLKKVDGVFSIKVYMSKPKAAASAAASPAVSLENATSEINDAFPEIAAIVADVHAELEPDKRQEQLFQLGVEVAASRLESGDISIPSSGGDFSAIINDAVVPELKKLGDVQFVEEGFETGLMMMSSVFTKSGEAASSIGGTFGSLNSEAIQCDFLCGYIAGITNAVAGQANSSYEVQEVRCRNEGHPYCLFDFDE